RFNLLRCVEQPLKRDGQPRSQLGSDRSARQSVSRRLPFYPAVVPYSMAKSAITSASTSEVAGPFCYRAAAGDRSRTASVRNAPYAFPSPSRRETLGFQPMADSLEMSTSFRGMPSGFEVS